MKNKSAPGVVYSTAHGRMCPDCGRPASACGCGGKKPGGPASSGGIVRVGRETKGRKGSGVTLVSGVPLDSAGLAALARELKKRCGSGGTIKDAVIEIQGDHRDTVIEELEKKGWKVKRAGG